MTMTTQNDLLKQLVEIRIKRYLIKNKTHYERELYNVVGRGVTPQEYLTIVNKLIAEEVITRTTGSRGAKSLHLVESQQG